MRSRNIWLGARETMEQQQLRRAGRAGLAIEDVEAVHIGSSILDGGHGISFAKSVDRLCLDAFSRARLPAIASRMMSTTTEGAVTIGA